MLVAGEEIVCVWAPPSDQDTKTFEPCGEGAPIVRVTLTTPTTAWGAVKGWPSSVS